MQGGELRIFLDRYTTLAISGRKVRRRMIARWGCFVLGSYPV